MGRCIHLFKSVSLRNTILLPKQSFKHRWLRALKDIVCWTCTLGLYWVLRRGAFIYLRVCPSETQFFCRSNVLSTVGFVHGKTLFVGPVHSDCIGCSVEVHSFVRECVPQEKTLFVGPLHSDSVGCSAELHSFLGECVLPEFVFKKNRLIEACAANVPHRSNSLLMSMSSDQPC